MNTKSIYRTLMASLRMVVESLETRRLMNGGCDTCGQNLQAKPDTGAAIDSIVSTANGATAGSISSSEVVQSDAATRTPGISVGSVVNISKAAGSQSEVDVAINPTNTNQIFAVSNASTSGLFTSRSSDGGSTWTTLTIATGSSADGLPSACCDARVRYDSYGNLWMVYIGPSGTNIYVARSTTNGASWTLTDSKTGSFDNPAIDVGANNQVWIEARRTAGTQAVIAYGAQATALGASGAFSAAQSVPQTSGDGNFGDIAVLNDGSVLITYTTPSGLQTTASDPIWRDPDGLGAQGFVGLGGSSTTTPLYTVTTNVGGFDYIPAQNSRSVDSEPNFAVARAGGLFPGRVYMTYTSEKVDEGNDTDITVIYSDNNGTTWSSPVIVNNDSSSVVRSQFLQSITVDPTTGAVIVSFHDARNDNGVSPNGTNAVANDEAQFYGAISDDGGVTWTNFQIDSGFSSAARDGAGMDYGDWTGSDFYGGRFVATWASNASTIQATNPSTTLFDLAAARVDITGVGAAGIVGTIYDDSNNNGTRDGTDAGISGVSVYIDGNTNGVFDSGETTTTTSATGAYSFTPLGAGTYVVRTVTPAGYRVGSQPAGASYSVTLSAAVPSASGKDFGFINPRFAGTVFNDANDNGVFDSGEAGLSGVTVYRDSNNNGSLDGGEVSVVSSATGEYLLGNLADGTYVIRAVTPSGKRLTLPSSGFYSGTINSANLIFTGDHFGFTDRARISGVVYNDASGDGVKQAGEAGIASVRVFQDVNNNGVYDSSAATLSSSDLPKTIADNTTVTSNLVVSGQGNISSLKVTLSLTHTYDADVNIYLISPLGTRVELSTGNGGSGDNYTSTIFDDAAATAVTAGTAPFTGTFKPEGSLATLIGQNANGTWQLEVSDIATADTGTLTAWSITLGAIEPSVVTPVGGAFSFVGLSAGTYNIRQESLGAGWVRTNPTTGLRTFTLAAGDAQTGDFGNFSTTLSGTTLADGYYIRQNASATTIEIFNNTTGIGAAAVTIAKSLISTLTFSPGSGDDTLVIDLVNGNPVTGGITFTGGADNDTLRMIGAPNAAETCNFNSTTSVSMGTLNVTVGTVEGFEYDGKLGNDTLSLGASMVVTVLATQAMNIVTLAAGATLTLKAGSSSVLDVTTLSVNATAKIDLTNNAIIYRTTGGLAAIRSLILTGQNGVDANGFVNWNGNGIISSTARTQNIAASISLYGVGAIRNGDMDDLMGVGNSYAMFHGRNVGAESVLVRYTYGGDATLDGTITFSDYVRIDSTYGGTSANRGWISGDFNFDGSITISDYVAIDTSYAFQGGTLLMDEPVAPATVDSPVAPVASVLAAPLVAPVEAQAATPSTGGVATAPLTPASAAVVIASGKKQAIKLKAKPVAPAGAVLVGHQPFVASTFAQSKSRKLSLAQMLF